MKIKLSFWRFLEILPGAVVWLSFIVPIVLSFFLPAVVAVYILLFDLFWLYKSVIIGFHLVRGYRMLKSNTNINWRHHLETLKNRELFNRWQKTYHAVILTMYKEELETLDASIKSIADSDYPQNKIIVVLATEARAAKHARPITEILTKRYKNKFFAFLVTEHPDGLPNEIKAKGANATWAAKKLREFANNHHINYENILVTTADADTRLHERYLACLAYKYVTNPDRANASFQPITLYSNNIWQAPAISRIIAFGNSYWQMVEATRAWRMVNFATHSMSLKMLVEINYWDKMVVNEDSRQFWRAYFRYNGKHIVVPILVPVYMDAVLAHTYWGTIRNQYLQKQRWAYGVEHFPYLVTEALKNKQAPFWDMWVRIWREFEGKVSWATASIYIAIFAWFPLLFGHNFNHTVLGANMMTIIRNMMYLTWIGIVISIWLSLILLPPRPAGYPKRKFIEMVFQWILMPVQAIFFSSIPAIDALTRFMHGKYMGFHVTEKKSV